MTYDEFLEKRRAKQDDKGVSPSKNDISQSYDDFRAERALRLNSDEQAAANYFENAAVSLDRFQSEIKNPQSTTYKVYSKSFEQLESDSKRVKNYIESLKGTENYDSMKSAFDSYSSAIASARAQLKSPAADAHIQSYLQNKYNSEKILSDIKQGRTTVANAAKEYWLNESQLQTEYDNTRAKEKQEERDSKYGGMGFDELVQTLKSPDSLGQRIYNEIQEEYGTYFKDYGDFDKNAVFKSRGEKYGLTGEQVREIYDRMHNANDKHYESAALGDTDKEFVVSRILQTGTVEQLEELQKTLPVAKHYDSLRYQLRQAIEDKKEQRYYLDIAERDPRVTQVMESIAAIDKELPSLANTTGAPTGHKGQFSNIMDAQETRTAYMRELEAKGYNAENMVKFYNRYRERMENEQAQAAVKDWTSQNGFNAALASVASVPVNMVGSLGDALKIALSNLGDDGWYDPKGTANYTAQNIRSTTSEMIDNATKDSGAWNYWAKQLYSSGMSGGDMVLAAAANAVPVVGQAASNAMFFSSAGVNAANEVIENGGDLRQATAAMIASGGAELLFERVSLDKLQALATSGNVADAKTFFKNIVKQAFVEGSEEFNTTLANTFTDALINGGNNSIAHKTREFIAQGMSEKEAENAAIKDWTQQIIDDAVGGALVGSVAGGAAGGYNYVQNTREDASLGKELLDSEDFDLNMLVEQGKQSTSAKAVELAEKLSEKQEKGDIPDAKSVGKLQSILQSESDMNERHLSEKLKGELTADERAIVAKVQNGTVLSKADVQTVNDSPRVEEAIARFTKADPEEIKSIDFDEKRGSRENFKPSDSGKTLVDNEEFTGGLEIASVDPRRGLIVYDLHAPDGTSKRTTSDKIRFKSAGEALLHERAASYNTEQARAFVENYRDGQDVDNYAREWNLYSNYGRLAVNLDANKMDVGGTLTNAQKIEAYQQGLNARIAHNQVQTIVNTANELKPYTSQKQGTFAYNIPATVRLTKEQAQLKNFFRDMSVVTGLNVELFQSQTDVNGNYTGENGSFDASTNTLRIDINAGLTHAGQKNVFAYSMLNTAAHELTHVARQGNKYENLREAVIAALGTTEKDFKTLVEKKCDQLRGNKRYDRLTDKELTELADEEVICDACETMLQGNTGFFENLYKKDKSLAKSFVDAIKNLVEKIKAFVTARKHANTEYGKALLEVADNLYNQIQQLWNEAVESGLEATYTQTAENKKAADMGGVKEQARRVRHYKGLTYLNTFPQYDESISDANTQAEFWARNPRIKEGDWKLAFYNGSWYIIVKRYNEGYGYVVTTKLKTIKDYENYHRMWEEQYGRSYKEGVEDCYNEINNLNRRAVKNREERSDFNDDVLKHSEQSKDFFGLGKFKNSEQQGTIDTRGSGSSSNDDISGEESSKVKRQDRTEQIYTHDFKEWFGDWQNDPQNSSKVVDNDGKPLVVYHQTGADFTVFDTESKGAGRYDDETPNGTFLKPSDNDIGLKGKKQMALYANIREPLRVNNRNDLVRFYSKNIPGYIASKQKINDIDTIYKVKFEEELKRENQEYQKYWEAWRRGEITEEEYTEYTKRDKLEELMQEWEEKTNEARESVKALISDFFKKSKYDGVIIEQDEGSFGRSTKTFIAFESEQVKSATDNIGTFDKNNPDIRYQDREYLSAVERGDMETAQKMVDEAAERAFKDSKVRDEDGKLLTVYHGSEADFSVFDKTKGRANMDIQGMFFSPWELDASGYGSKVRKFYLNITNPANESTGYKALYKHRGENNAGIKAREYLVRMGFDGVNNEDEEFIAFDSEQIKSADPVTYDDDGNVIPLSERFKTDNADIRYQDRDYSVEPEEYGDLFDDLFTDDGDLSFGEETDTRRAESIIDKMIEYDAENAAYFLSYSAGEIAQNTLNGLKDIELSDSAYLRIAKKFYNNSTVRLNVDSETIAEQVKSFVLLYDDGMFDSFDAFLSEIVKWNDQHMRSDKFASPENMLTNAYTLISYIAEEKAGYAGSAGALSEKYAKMERTSSKAKAEVKRLKAENEQLNRSLSYQENAGERYRSENIRSRAEIAKLQMLNRQLEKARTKAEQQADRRIERTVKRYNARLDRQKLKAGEQKAAALDRMRERYERLLTAEKAKAKERRRVDHDKVVERYEKRIAALKEKSEQQKRAIREDRDTKLIAAKEKRQADLKALRDNRDKKEYVRKIKKVATELQQWALHPTDKHFVPQEFLRSGFYRAVNEITEALMISDNTKIADKLREIAADVQKLQQESEFQYDIDPVIAAEMNQLASAIGGRKINRDLTLRQAEDIYKALRLIKDSVVNARKLIFENETRDMVQTGVDIINEQRALKPVFINRNLNNIKKFFLTPERVHNIINGYNEDSALNKVFQEIKLGIRKKNTFYMDANKMFDAYRNAHVKALDRSQHTVREVKWTDNAGHERTTKMTGMQAIQLVMTWNREAADDRLVHMKKGGVSILNPDKLAKGNIKQAYVKRENILGINESFITGVSRSLTDFERGYMDIAEQFFNGMAKDAINEVSLKLRHFETATSEYYIPVKVDDAEIVREIEGVKHDSSIENTGMLKSIVPHSNKSVLIHGLDNVINKHIENVGNYFGLAIPIRNMNKVLNVSDTVRNEDGTVLSRDSVKRALEENWGKLATDNYEQLLIDLQNSRAPKNEKMQDVNAIVRKIRSNFVTATLNANISVVIKQAASYATAGVYLDQTALAKGSADMLKYLRPGKYQALLDEIDSHTAQHYMRRAGLSSLEIAAVQESWFKNSKLGRVINHAKPIQKAHGLNPANWIQEMDCMTTAALWCATKAQIDKNYKKAGKQVETDAYWRDVADLYDKVIEDTQPMYDAMHRPEILKSSNEFVKSVFMFKTQPLQNSGIIYDSIGKVMQNKKDKAAWKQLGKAIMSQGKSLLVFAGMSLVAALLLHRMDRYKDEDDEVNAQSIWDTFIKDVIQNGAGVVLPFGGNEGAGTIINMMDTGKLDASSMVQDNVAETVTNFLGAGTNLVNTIGEQFDKEKHDAPDTDVIAKAAEKMVVTWISDIFGVPVKNAKNIVNGGIEWAKDIADEDGLSLSRI